MYPGHKTRGSGRSEWQVSRVGCTGGGCSSGSQHHRGHACAGHNQGTAQRPRELPRRQRGCSPTLLPPAVGARVGSHLLETQCPGPARLRSSLGVGMTWGGRTDTQLHGTSRHPSCPRPPLGLTGVEISAALLGPRRCAAAPAAQAPLAQPVCPPPAVSREAACCRGQTSRSTRGGGQQPVPCFPERPGRPRSGSRGRRESLSLLRWSPGLQGNGVTGGDRLDWGTGHEEGDCKGQGEVWDNGWTVDQATGCEWAVGGRQGPSHGLWMSCGRAGSQAPRVATDLQLAFEAQRVQRGLCGPQLLLRPLLQKGQRLCLLLLLHLGKGVPQPEGRESPKCQAPTPPSSRQGHPDC